MNGGRRPFRTSLMAGLMVTSLTSLLAIVSLVLSPTDVLGQLRVTPAKSKGGANYGPYAEPWVGIPESFRNFNVPEWPVPTSLDRWNQVDRKKVRETLLTCLGDLPPRPGPEKVVVLSKDEQAEFTLERIEFHNGVDMVVPGILKHFDSEAIYSLVAPRPMLMLSGDQDYNAPPDGIEVLEQKIGAVYRLYGKSDSFRSVLYKNTGHEYLPEMKAEMIEWFQRHLPADK